MGSGPQWDLGHSGLAAPAYGAGAMEGSLIWQPWKSRRDSRGKGVLRSRRSGGATGGSEGGDEGKVGGLQEGGAWVG
mgnify:CR=1 FL=1